MTVIESLACCWILAGDWNCSWDDLQQSSFPRLSQAGVFLPAQATTTQGSTLDYAICSRELVGLLVPTVTRDVPFRPHAGISYQRLPGTTQRPAPPTRPLSSLFPSGRGVLTPERYLVNWFC